jgi:hypothetical protein
MIRALLATTAVAALVATASLAQDASPSSEAPMSSEMMSSEMMSSEMPISSEMSAPAESTMSTAPSEPAATATVAPSASFDILTGYTRVDTDRLSSRIVGQPVYDSTAADANNLGNINDLVLNEAGMVQAVVIGVGGFLGIGEKQVAVAYSALQWVVAADNTERFVLDATVEQLTNAPDFVTVDDAPSAM